MLRLLIVITLAWASPWSLAEPAPAQVVQGMQQHPLIAGQFVQTRQLQGLPRPITSSGNFIFWRQHGLYWETLQPFYQATTFTADEVITWLAPEGPAQQAPSRDPVQKYVNRILLSVFGADMSMIDKLFSSQWQTDGDNWSVALTPANAAVEKAIAHAHLSGAQYLQQLQVTSRSGDVSTMVFDQVQAPTQLAAAQCARFSRDGAIECPQAATSTVE